MFKKILLIICVFLLGVLAANIYAYYSAEHNELQLPENNGGGGYEYQNSNALSRALAMLQETGNEIASPASRIAEDNIMVLKDKVVLNIQDAEWAYFTDTNSMDPVIDEGAHAIEVVPKTEGEIKVGDIVAYESEYAEGTIIHRVVFKGEDEQGTYFTLKGDNNPVNDPGRIRFSQIKSVVVAIIY
ncbi:signal peptidase I [Candidatus Woesearchaeota archaeon]|nr:signal peptidase I [Candidatus Woesearchaeota archaeon]